MSLELIASTLAAAKLALSKPKIELLHGGTKIAQMQDIFKGPKNVEQNVEELAKIIRTNWGCFYSKDIYPSEYKTIYRITCNWAGMNDFNIRDIISELNQIGLLSKLQYEIEYNPIKYSEDDKVIPAEFMLITRNFGNSPNLV
ncbi:MAG: hypothetical protein WCK98_05340 [bacterium]